MQWSSKAGMVPAGGALPDNGFRGFDTVAPAGYLDGIEAEALEPAAPLAKKKALVPVRKSKLSDKPIDVLKLAKARLREVKRQLKQMKKLEVEQKELERLIAAAMLPVT